MDRTSEPNIAASRPRQGWAFLRTQGWWLCAIALGIHHLGIALLNTAMFPLFADVLLEARDIGSIVSTVFELILYGLAVTRPQLMEPRRAIALALICVGAGAPLMALTAQGDSAALLVAATCLRALGSAWIGCIVCLPLVDLVVRHGTRSAMAALCGGWALCYALEAAFSYAPLGAQIAAFCIAPFAVAALAWRGSSAVIERTLASSPAADLRITNPASFLPLGNAVFVMIILLKMSFGFSMTFASDGVTPLDTVIACIPALFIAVCLTLAAKPGLGLNGFYRATMLCVLAGFLLVNPLIGEITGMPALANVVLRAGSDLTRMFSFLLVAYIGARNPMNALSVSLYLGAANSLGSVCGAQLGLAANAVLASNEGLFALLLAGIVLAFVAYNVLAPTSFDFDKTASSIEEVAAPQPSASPDALSVAAAQIARDRGLTPREAEALELLAHGRNTQAIQERMVVSRSTAKTHVRNVYAKLEVHSQQALIDLVEQAVKG